MIYECLMLMLMLCKSSYARLTPEVLHNAHHFTLNAPRVYEDFFRASVGSNNPFNFVVSGASLVTSSLMAASSSEATIAAA